MEKEPVYYRKTSPASLNEDVANILDQSLGNRLDTEQQTLIKINGNYDQYYPGSNSSPWFVNALLKALRDYGFTRLVVVEGDLPQFKARDMIVRTRLKPILDKYGVPFVDYEDHDRDAHEIPHIFRESQLINNPVPHGHGIAKISCACKNLFGVPPITRRRHHGRLSDKLIELVTELPMYTVVDGTVGLDGESTRRGNPRQMDFVAAGYDPYAIDVMVGRVLGFAPRDIPLLVEAEKRGLVDFDIDLRGDATDLEVLPLHPFPYRLSKKRRFSMWLEDSRIGNSPLFLWFLHHVIRVNHLVTFARKKKALYSGPWMRYAEYI